MTLNLDQRIINLYHSYKVISENSAIEQGYISDQQIEDTFALLILQKTCLSLLTNLLRSDNATHKINYQNYVDLYKDIPDKLKAIEILEKYNGNFRSTAQLYSKKLLELVQEGIFSTGLTSHRITNPERYANSSRITKSLLTQLSILSAICSLEKNKAKENTKLNVPPKSTISEQEQQELEVRREK